MAPVGGPIISTSRFSYHNLLVCIFCSSEFVSLLFVCVSDFSFSALAHRLICVPLAFAFAPKQVDCKDNHRDWCWHQSEDKITVYVFILIFTIIISRRVQSSTNPTNAFEHLSSGHQVVTCHILPLVTTSRPLVDHYYIHWKYPRCYNLHASLMPFIARWPRWNNESDAEVA